MYKRILLLAMAMMLLLTGCGKGDASKNSSAQSSDNKSSSEDISQEMPQEESETEKAKEPLPLEKPLKQIIDEEIATLQNGLYPGLTLNAAVLERKAILPGEVFRVNVTVTNEGDQEISYYNGSGSFTVPESLKLYIDGMQTIQHVDRLGPATMDISYKSLKPGESLTYDYYVIALKESDQFAQVTSDLYMSEEKYIGEMGLEEFLEKYPQFIVSDSGGYQGQVFFTYLYKQEGESVDPSISANGYTQAEFGITIS